MPISGMARKKNGSHLKAASRCFIRDGMTSNDYLFKR
ncbi:hypothetical protein PS659_00499 [Pseudomonas fluorescens]|uniref:Uncharacterized protein n=1 Tax=Pseudomonas fluorescens TaxID=294 RepID=A0A5E6PR38_PSEFL|nr:hypothetical protein PS659_00499 [Pseudomonas fluorescens]